jgi:hypothetical protein
VGYNGPLAFWFDAHWSPPLPSLLLLVAYAAVLVALAVWLWGDAAARTGLASETSETTIRTERGGTRVASVSG